MGCCDGRGQLWYQSLSLFPCTNLDTREALSITELLPLHSLTTFSLLETSESPEGHSWIFPSTFCLSPPDGDWCFNILFISDSLASARTGVLKRKNLVPKQEFRGSRRAFCPCQALILDGEKGNEERMCLVMQWGFLSYFRKLVSVICMSFEGKKLHTQDLKHERI